MALGIGLSFQDKVVVAFSTKNAFTREALMIMKASLRRHDPDQVLRVEGCGPPLSPAYGLPVQLL
jgi:hypothetical protein